MRAPAWSGQFKRDLRAARKRGKDMEKINAVMRLLIDAKPLSHNTKTIRLRVGGAASGMLTSSRIGC